MGNTCCPPPRENPKGSQQTGQTGFDNQIPKKQQSSFNKEKCKSIAKGLPTRTQTDYHSFKELLKSKTNNLSQIEKSYVIFLWIADNISYLICSLLLYVK